MKTDRKDNKDKRLSASFITGAIALVFLAIGYQTALFVYRASSLKILADANSPDTVYVYGAQDSFDNSGDFPEQSHSLRTKRGENASRSSTSSTTVSRYTNSSRISRGQSSTRVNEIVASYTKSQRKCESFTFDPNTISVEDLCRLGLSLKQAQSIENYRNKGGRFRRKQDFAKSYAVPDSVYKRLESFIDIPKLDINAADSSDFDNLPGIGGYFAAKMVAYRQSLGGYSCAEQLMEIYNFGEERYQGLKDLVTVDTPAKPFCLWSLPADSLVRHPHIRNYQVARSIVLYRENNPTSALTVSGLAKAGIIDHDTEIRLSRCAIEKPKSGPE